MKTETKFSLLFPKDFLLRNGCNAMTRFRDMISIRKRCQEENLCRLESQTNQYTNTPQTQMKEK